MKLVLFVYFVLYLTFICSLLFSYYKWKNAEIIWSGLLGYYY